jgi:hypothetical protein
MVLSFPLKAMRRLRAARPQRAYPGERTGDSAEEHGVGKGSRNLRHCTHARLTLMSHTHALPLWQRTRACVSGVILSLSRAHGGGVDGRTDEEFGRHCAPLVVRKLRTCAPHSCLLHGVHALCDDHRRPLFFLYTLYPNAGPLFLMFWRHGHFKGAKRNMLKKQNDLLPEIVFFNPARAFFASVHAR